MDSDRWQRVQSLFESALKRRPGQVSAFLEEACDGDAALRREVEALLVADAEAGDFIEAAVGDSAKELADEGTAGALPTRFGKYEVEAKIGEGGFGVVYRGRDPMLGRRVAIKTCAVDDEKRQQRFLREGRLAAGLQHANITTVHDLGDQDGTPYLVQEFLPGEDLDRLIERNEPATVSKTLDVLIQVARGLAYAHDHGVLHRDIKPANIRLLGNGAVKIMDFGIAKSTQGGKRLTASGATLGTAGYLAPEQLRGEAVDARADVFAFGALAYEWCSRSQAFPGDNFAQISRRLLHVDPPLLSRVWLGCPPRLDAVVQRCLAKEAEDRYPDFSQVLAELEPLFQKARTNESIEAMPTLELPAVTSPPRTSHKSGWFIAGMVLAVLAGSSVFWLWPASRDDEPPTTTSLVSTPDITSESDETPLLSPPVADSEPIETMRLAETVDIETPAPTSADSQTIAAEPLSQPPVQGETPSSGLPPPPNPSPPAPLSHPLPPAGREGKSLPADSRGTGGGAPLPGGREAWMGEGSGERGSPAEEILQDDTESAASERQSEPAVPRTEDATSQAIVLEPSMQPGDLIPAGAATIEPRLLARPQPAYPTRARRRGREATVTVRVLVDETGGVLQAVTAEDDRWGFAEAAKKAALDARFEPAEQDGIVGKMWTEVTFEFSLQ